MHGSRWRAAILPLLLAASAATAQEPAEPGSRHEVLDYAIEWRLIPAGTAKLTWAAMPSPSAATSEINLHLESTGIVSRLFRVNDDYTVLMSQNFCAQTTFLSAREGNRHRETRITFDQQAHKAAYIENDLVKNATNQHEVDIPPCVHDVIGGLMVLRTLRLEPGKTVQIPVTDGKKVAQVKIESQQREDISTPDGVRHTIRYEIFLFDNVLFKRSGHMHIWLTDDSTRLPVQLQVRLQITIGTITFRLQKQEKS